MTPDRSPSRRFGFLFAANLGVLVGALGVWGSLAIFGDRPPEVCVLAGAGAIFFPLALIADWMERFYE